jgi:hypothetical protein
MKTNLSGNFILVNEAFLREKAHRQHDPRHVFYRAMLNTRTYEDYLNLVGDVEVSVDTYKKGPISGRKEILYARQKHWIDDAKTIA